MPDYLERKVVLNNELGMHLRAAGRFVQLASRFKSEVVLAKENLEVDGKSIMGILSLASPYGEEIVIRTRGMDAPDALNALVKLVESGFGEK